MTLHRERRRVRPRLVVAPPVVAPLVVALLTLASCAVDPVDQGAVVLDADLPVTADDAALIALEAPRLLRRMSLDLRGHVPTAAELDQVEADPTALETLRDSFMDDPAFEERLVVLFGERWYTRLDAFVIIYSEYPSLTSEDEYPWERSIGEEPLRLLAHVAAGDSPWTDIVTADYTMSNERLSEIWPVDYPAGDSGWQAAHYTDGRPAAGVLSTNGLWWRYYSTLSNYNRGRAAALTRLLLCDDYLVRPVSFDNNVALVDTEGVESALRSNPYCLGCHSSLDPTASALFGFWVANVYSGDEMSNYHAEREPLGASSLGVTPEFFGRPVAGLAELGQLIGEDPRFARCTARSVAELLWRRDVGVADFDRVEGLRQAYLDGGERLKPLIAAVTDTAVYRAGGMTESIGETEADAEATVRLLNATLLRSTLDDLVGFAWEANGFDLLDNDTTGFRVMAGGVDGDQVTRPQDAPNLTWSLTLERAAEAASQVAVQDLGQAGTLLEGVSAETQPTDAAFQTQLDTLSWRLLGERATVEELDELSTLWAAVGQTEGPQAAWRAVLVATMRDPRFGSY